MAKRPTSKRLNLIQGEISQDAVGQSAYLLHIAEKATEDYLRSQSIRFLECAVNLCATHMPTEAVADLLEAQAEMLREHG